MRQDFVRDAIRNLGSRHFIPAWWVATPPPTRATPPPTRATPPPTRAPKLAPKLAPTTRVNLIRDSLDGFVIAGIVPARIKIHSLTWESDAGVGFYNEVCGKRSSFPKKKCIIKLRVLHHAIIQSTTNNLLSALKGTYAVKILFYIMEGVSTT
jgi:hypothetical protein